MHGFSSVTNFLQHPNAFGVMVLVALVPVGAAALYVLSRLDVAVLVIGALVLEMFSGNWGLVGAHVPLDRVALLLAAGSVVLRGARNLGSRRLVLRPVHLAMLAAATWCAISAIMVGTLTSRDGFYAFLDRFGIVPFLLFSLAPLFFGDERQRRKLLVGLTAIGLYIGFIGCLEGVHLYKFIFPRYIADPNVGIQWGRARGPILETTGNGFCAFVGATAAAIGLATWTSRWAVWTCRLTLGLDAGAVFFGLTRGVWIGAFVGFVGAMLLTRKSRRALVPLLLVGTIAVGGTLAASHTVRNEVFGRAVSQSPIWDRQNTDVAALNIVKAHPLTGVGWQNFPNVSIDYYNELSNIPETGQGLEVHNVLLSHAAELGLPGLLLWLLAFGAAARRALFPNRFRPAAEEGTDRDLQLWRAGAFAILLCFLVESELAPLSQALPNSLLWTWLGVCAVPYTSVRRAYATVTAKRGSPARPAAPAHSPTPEVQPVYL